MSDDAEQHPRNSFDWGPLARLWQRISHVYRTRVRTTTVLLIVAFLVGLPLYGYTSQHYEEPAAPQQNQQQRQDPEKDRSPTVSEQPSAPAESGTSGIPETSGSPQPTSAVPDAGNPSSPESAVPSPLEQSGESPAPTGDGATQGQAPDATSGVPDAG